jgi:LPS-assembly protein
MFKFNKIILSVILATTLAQAEAKDIEVYAKEVLQDNGVVAINDGVVVEYDGSIFRADSAKYSIDKKYLNLKGNVTLIDKSGKRIRAKELRLDLGSNIVILKDFFTLAQDHIWFSSTEGSKKKNFITSKNALFSSCSVDNPDWMLGFNKAIYDTEREVVRFYDAKVYIKKIPVFYFPYIHVPLSNERRSGFLYPSFNISGNEGFTYRQPYFINISRSQDLEVIPQVMTKRGYGLTATYRFFHDKDAFGTLRTGFYKDKISYVKKEDLIHNNHYGLEFNYLNSSLIDSLAESGYENKLYINSAYFNDGEYFALQQNTLSHHLVGSHYDSRINYYIQSKSLYSGIILDYFKSTAKSNNNDTLQILPQLQFHLPFSSIVSNNIHYSFDATVANLTRKEGSRAIQASIKMPISMHFSLLDNYLNLNISEELQLDTYRFINTTSNIKKYTRVSANHKVELFADLTKVYDSGVHTMMLSAAYTKSTNITEKWTKYSEIPLNLKQEFVDDLAYDSKISLRAHQKWQSLDKPFNVNHILEADYSVKNKKFTDLDNTLNLKYNNWFMNTFIGYSLEKHNFDKISNQIGYSNGDVGLTLGYLWSKDYQSFATLSKELTLRSYYKYSERLKVSAGVDYDLATKNVKKWGVTTDLNRKCWAVSFTFGQSIRPVVRASGNSSIKNNFFSFNFTVLPFGSSYGR